MKTLKEVTRKALTQYIDPVEPVFIGWPPACTALLYQPERPMSVNPKTSDSIPQKEEKL